MSQIVMNQTAMNQTANTALLEKLIPALSESITRGVLAAMGAINATETPQPPTRLETLYSRYEDYPEMLTTTQAAKMIGVSYAKMYEVARSKNSPFTIWGKSHRMVRKIELIKYLEERRGGYLLDQYRDDSGA